MLDGVEHRTAWLGASRLLEGVTLQGEGALDNLISVGQHIGSEATPGATRLGMLHIFVMAIE